MNSTLKRQRGFTLVELSIVLVIIGLIISSVLVGQDLIRSSELRATITQYEQFNAAIGTFRGKYSGIPGDVAGATNFGFVGNGNGDGTLEVSTSLKEADPNIDDEDGENVAFWNHLGSSGASLISGSYDGDAVTTANIDSNLPSSKSGEYWGVYDVSGINYFVVGVSGGASGDDYTTTAVFNPLDAMSIDEKVDDGRPYRGVVQARGADGDDADTDPTFDTTAGDEACTTGASALSTSSTYNTQFTGIDCTLRFRFNL